MVVNIMYLNDLELTWSSFSLHISLCSLINLPLGLFVGYAAFHRSGSAGRGTGERGQDIEGDEPNDNNEIS